MKRQSKEHRASYGLSEEILTANNGQRMGIQHMYTVLTDQEEDTRLNSKTRRSHGQASQTGDS